MNSTTQPHTDDDAMMAASLWCLRLSEGDLSREEWQQFDAWRDVPGNDELLERVSAAWSFTGEIGNEPEIIPFRTDALDAYRQANQQRWNDRVLKNWVRPSAIAASLAVMLAFGAMYFGSGKDTFSTEVGERRIAALDDGSQVSIDAATELTVAIGDSARTIELVKGRAKFDVAKDPLRPFAVAAGDKLIVATGTSFSVEIVHGEVRVILYEGSVEVRDRSDKASGNTKLGMVRQVMTPGQELIDPIGVKGPANIVRVDQEQTLSWEAGMLSFDDTPLVEAVERVNRYSKRKIVLKDSAMANITIDGEFRAGDASSFAEGVAQVHGLQIELTEQQMQLARP